MCPPAGRARTVSPSTICVISIATASFGAVSSGEVDGMLTGAAGARHPARVAASAHASAPVARRRERRIMLRPYAAGPQGIGARGADPGSRDGGSVTRLLPPTCINSGPRARRNPSRVRISLDSPSQPELLHGQGRTRPTAGWTAGRDEGRRRGSGERPDAVCGRAVPCRGRAVAVPCRPCRAVPWRAWRLSPAGPSGRVALRRSVATQRKAAHSGRVDRSTVHQFRPAGAEVVISHPNRPIWLHPA